MQQVASGKDRPGFERNKINNLMTELELIEFCTQAGERPLQKTNPCTHMHKKAQTLLHVLHVIYLHNKAKLAIILLASSSYCQSCLTLLAHISGTELL